MLRLFVALKLPDQFAKSVYEKFNLSAAKKECLFAFIPPENLHLTLKFLGQTKEELVPDILKAVYEFEKFLPLELRFKNLGVFPNARHPRVAWLGVEDQDFQLSSLARALDERLEKLGFAPEKRSYTPHLTIARIKAGRLTNFIKENAGVDLGSEKLGELRVFESKTLSAGVRYKVLGQP